MGKVDWTDEAARWLRTIYDHIAQDDSEAAEKTVRAILSKVQTLATLPRLGQQYASRIDVEIRVLRYGHYRIPYLVEATDDVMVLGVFHERMNIKRFLDHEE